MNDYVKEYKEKEYKEKDPNEVHGQSRLYMFIFYAVSLLVIGSMIFHFISLRGYFMINIPYPTMSSEKLTLDQITVSTELIKSINDAIPYGNLVVALILYCLGMFGFEGTRSVIMSFDLSKISDKAKNMPRYKRNRLIQILITFILITILAMIFQMICINHGITKADFQLPYLTSGIGIFMGLLAYADFGPKLSKQIGNFVSDISKKEDKKESSDKDDDEESFSD